MSIPATLSYIFEPKKTKIQVNVTCFPVNCASKFLPCTDEPVQRNVEML